MGTMFETVMFRLFGRLGNTDFAFRGGCDQLVGRWASSLDVALDSEAGRTSIDDGNVERVDNLLALVSAASNVDVGKGTSVSVEGAKFLPGNENLFPVSEGMSWRLTRINPGESS